MQSQRLSSASARGQDDPPGRGKGRGWQQYLHLLRIHLLASFFGRAIFNGVISVTQDVEVQLRKQLRQWWEQAVRTWGQGSPLGQPHHGSHHRQRRGSGEVWEERGFPLAFGCTNTVLLIPFKTQAGFQAGALPLPRLCEGLSRIHEKS